MPFEPGHASSCMTCFLLAASFRPFQRRRFPVRSRSKKKSAFLCDPAPKKKKRKKKKKKHRRFCGPFLVRGGGGFVRTPRTPIATPLTRYRDGHGCEARLPPDKLDDLWDILRQCNSRSSITKNELASLLGKLSFAARVVVPGRTSMHCLWDLKAKYDHPKIKPHYRVALDAACPADIKWWNVFLYDWNSRSFFIHNTWTQATELGLYTDASGAWGFGAFYGVEQRWIQGQWSGEDKEKSIVAARRRNRRGMCNVGAPLVIEAHPAPLRQRSGRCLRPAWDKLSAAFNASYAVWSCCVLA